ncbi:MAG TPA: toprim domain-containing protein [Gemmataceae bacterium]|nr:toprim domain-containing protein [Gemmataceae bacterium]
MLGSGVYHPPPFAANFMPPEKKFINVDELMPQLGLADVARYYGVLLPDLTQVGNQTRMRCFLNCGKTQETGDRALAVQTDHPAKQWHCHQYGCGKGGNLVSMCDLLKPGDAAGGRPRGQRFKDIAADMRAMVEGGAPPPAAAQATAPGPLPEAKRNVPLAESPNERARALTALDGKFTLDLAKMPPRASSYFRRRPFLSPEVCRTWRAGYLPRDIGEDKSGGTMRGKIVYPYLSECGEVLTWFGRDPEFEEKHKAWEATDRTEREPEKFHFIKGFHRGLELFGQHLIRAPEHAEKLKQLGLVLVEGPNDAIRLATLGVPAVALCSNTITREQAAKAAGMARELCNGIVTIFLDCDPEGENGMKQCLGYLAQLTAVRLAWTSKMYGGRFKGRQPESLSIEDWQEIEAFLRSGEAKNWSLT